MSALAINAIQIPVRKAQHAVLCCDKRFRILVAGRRFGKTQVALLELFRSVCGRDRLAWYVAPTYKQAKRIAWTRLKELTRPYQPTRIYETDLRIDFPWNASIAIRGADNYDSLRGQGLDCVVLDEYAGMAAAAWAEVLRPMLSDRQGSALFVGTPQGHNHFYELFEAAQGQPDWATFQFTTEQGGNVSAEELAAAARLLDQRTYSQEYQARFETLGTGRVYYAFERADHVRPVQYRPGYPLFWSLDFNVNPMCSLIGQMVEDGVVQVLDEIVLKDSNTPAACAAFLKRLEQWPMRLPQPLWIYGDASGNQRHCSASRTDWQIVKDCLKLQPGQLPLTYKIGSDNPPIKDRINCVNARLRNQAGEHRLRIDPRCRELIRDLEEVVWKTDPYGNASIELDKSDPRRTHVSDALGYLIAREFPMQPKMGPRYGTVLL